MVEEAVIIAGGFGSRLAGFHDLKPKGFITLENDVPIVKQSIDKLLEAGIKRIIIGTGHLAEYYNELAKQYSCVTTVHNANYANTGSMGTLEVAAKAVSGDCLLLESDLIYEKSGLKVLLDVPYPDVLLASGKTNSGDEVWVEISEEQTLVNLSKKKEELRSVFGELSGINKYSYQTLMDMCKYAESMRDVRPKMEYEEAMVNAGKIRGIHVHKFEKFIWCEIDDERQYWNAVKKVYPAIKAAEQKLTNLN